MRIIWLSHILDLHTPLYRGANDLDIRQISSIAAGDSSNSSLLCLPSHAGTHVDVPRHFLPYGKTIDLYEAGDWFFESPWLLQLNVKPGQIVSHEDIPWEDERMNNTDLLLLKTGFENRRNEDIYWQCGPGLSASFGEHLGMSAPHVRAVGVDFLSISSLAARKEGRSAHRALLSQGVIIFEDLSLCQLSATDNLIRVIALPLRFAAGDGAPCSVIGCLDE